MADTLGEAYISIIAKNDTRTGIEEAKETVKRGTKEIEAELGSSSERTLASKKAFNQQHLKEIERLNNEILSLEKQLAKENLNVSNSYNEADAAAQYQHAQNIIKSQEKLNNDILESKKSLNQQRLREEAIASNSVDKAISSQMQSWQRSYDQQIAEREKYESRFAQIQDDGRTRQQKALNDINERYRKNEEDLKIIRDKGIISESQYTEASARNKARQGQLVDELKGRNADLGKTFQETTAGVLRAAPAFAFATAVIASVYTALRSVRDEFIDGLKAVEDYQLKVASMSAFLVTFSKDLTQTNAGEIYLASKGEAEKLVKTMEILDARTIATGKDLTTMAEQFIKGGVKIDTSNKETLDGFVNIANALKLLTQGQNQEIQMRQEIRALTQGQVRDQNIVVQTLKSIDPNIKEHIKLWKYQGTLIENVGDLLKGFGPAAKELQGTWAVVGSTMETIHNRILRDAFKPTYDSLIEKAKTWNSLLMDSNGNLTTLSRTIQGMISLFLDFGGVLAKIAAPFAIFGASIGIFKLVTLVIEGTTIAVAALSAATAKNPILMGAIVIGTGIAYMYDFSAAAKEATRKTEEMEKKVVDLGYASNNIGEFQDALAKLREEANKKLDADSWITKLKEFFPLLPSKDELNLLKNYFLGGEQTATPSIPRGQTFEMAYKEQDKYQYGIPLAMPQKLTKAELEGMTEELNKSAAAWEKNALGIRATNVQKAQYDLNDPTGKLRGEIAALEGIGHYQEAAALRNRILNAAARKDAEETAKKVDEQRKSSIESLNSQITSLNSLNLTEKRSQAAIWESKFADENFRKSLHLTSGEIEEYRKKIQIAAEAADFRKAENEASGYIDKLKSKLESLQGPISDTEQLNNWENQFVNMMFAAGSATTVTSAQLDIVYEKLNSFFDLFGKVKSEISSKAGEQFSLDLARVKKKVYPYSVSAKEDESIALVEKLRSSWEKLPEDVKNSLGITEKEINKYYTDIITLDSNWQEGIKNGLDEYSKNTTSVFKTTKDAVVRTFKAMEDSLVEFVKTGKFNFTNLIDSMVTDLIRFQIQQSITRPLAEGLTGSNFNFLSGIFSLFSANGNAFNMGGVPAFANGGTFTNSIVTQPTIFPFANGIGMMGEAGPEAIMPLERSSNGSLGVRATGTSSPNITVNVIESPGNGGQSQQRETPQGTQIDIMVDQLIAKKQNQRGSAANRSIRQNFGVKETLVSR